MRLLEILHRTTKVIYAHYAAGDEDKYRLRDEAISRALGATEVDARRRQ